jgi:arylsulfatase A-like enzyme
MRAVSNAIPWTSRACALVASLVLATCDSSGEKAVGERLSALLITMDTTRADAIGCFGGPAGATPALDALAKECVLYETARTTAPITLPSHSSMMTGLYPIRHTVRDNGVNPLPASALTIAERAHAAGFQTGAVVAAVVLDSSWGIGQGFEFFDSRAEDTDLARVRIPDRPAHEVVAVAQDWLRKRDPTRPFFLWVHFFDAHAPYEPPPRFLPQAKDDEYLGEVAAMDHAIGTLIGELREDRTLDRTLVVVVADHGESLGQHGEPTHAVFCYEPTIHVPLLVRHPDGWQAGTRTRETVSVVDVYPTICDALELGKSDGIDGLSLFRRAVPADRAVYFESYYPYMNFGWSPLVGIADQRGKLIHGASDELYRTDVDPRESNDLAAASASEVARYHAAIAALASRPALAVSESDTVDESRRSQIQALGYAGAADASTALPAPLEPTGRMDPRARLEEYADYRTASEMGPESRKEAIAILERIVADNPLNVSAFDHLGSDLVDEQRCADAAAVLERLTKLGSQQAKRHTGVGRCFEQQGDLARAIAHYERAVALSTGGVPELGDLVRGLQLAGRSDEAAALRAKFAPSPQQKK